MNAAVTASLPPEELAELDRVCRQKRVSRAVAVSDAIRWYIARGGELPEMEYAVEDERVDGVELVQRI